MIKSRLISVIILVLFSSVMLAQNATLKGVIIDGESDDPIPFVNVYLKSDGTIGTSTDFEGYYQFKLNAGNHEIVFSSIEYGETVKSITLVDGETKVINLELSMKAQQLGTIIVKTDKYAKPIEDVVNSLEVIKPNVLENKASTDVTTALEQAPGVTIVDNEPQIRGGSGYSFGAGSRVMVTVDDLPLLSGDAGRPSWSFIPIENIEQIEIVKGASSVLYGSSAINGSINVRTAYPTSDPKTVVTLNTGIWTAPKRKEAKWWGFDSPFYTSLSFFHGRKVNDYFSFTLGANLYMESGYVGPSPMSAEEFNAGLFVDSTNSYTLNPREYENRARINFTTRFKAKKLKGLTYGVNANFMYSRSAGTLLWADNNEGLYRAFPGAITKTNKPEFNIDPYVKYRDNKGNEHAINTRFYYLDNQNDNNQANQSNWFYGEYRYMKRFAKIPDFKIIAGGVGQYVDSESNLYAAGDTNSVERTQTNVAVYMQIEKKFFGRLNILIGGRWEYFKEADNEENQPIGRFGFSYKAAKATFIRGSIGQGFRFPTIAEKYIYTVVGGIPIFPNEELEPETAWSAEIGVKQGIKIGKFLGYADISGFISRYDNYIEFLAGRWLPYDASRPGLASVGFGFRSTNTGKTQSAGLDFSLLGQGNFSDDFGISVLAGYTWSRPITLDPQYVFDTTYDGTNVTYISTSTDSTNNILKYRYEHLIKADIEINYKKLSAGVSFRYYSFMQNLDQIFYSDLVKAFGIYIEEYREENTEPEYVFDFRISYQFTKTSKLALIVNNALNREYALRPLDINPPRSVAIQYTLKIN